MAVLTMRAGLTEAEEIGEFTSEEFEPDIPTTATLSQGALWIVNARVRHAAGARHPYWITRLPMQR